MRGHVRALKAATCRRTPKICVHLMGFLPEIPPLPSRLCRLSRSSLIARLCSSVAETNFDPIAVRFCHIISRLRCISGAVVVVAAVSAASARRLPAMPKRCAKAGRSYSAGFAFGAVLFRLRGCFRDFGAAPLRIARVFCSCSEADASRWRRSLRSLRSCFSCK